MALKNSSIKWVRHLSVVERQPSMELDPNIGPFKMLSNYYIIGKTDNATSCYIISHGGHFRTDYKLTARNFTVPRNTTVQFFHDHGDAFSYNFYKLGKGEMPKTKRSEGQKIYTANTQCHNYILNKFQGEKFGGDDDYKALQEFAKEGDQVFVTVRNRWYHAGVTLSNAISVVQSECPQIRTFHCTFCRATDGYTTWYSGTLDSIKSKVNDQWGGWETY